MGLRPKSTANLCHMHPGHLKTLRRAATSQLLYERSFIVSFGRDMLPFIFSITNAIWPIGTFEVTALAGVAFGPFYLSPSALCNWYFPEGSPSLFSVWNLDVLMNFHQVFGCLVTLVVVLVSITIFFVLVGYAQHFSQKEGQAIIAVLVLLCIHLACTAIDFPLDLLVGNLTQWLFNCIALIPDMFGIDECTQCHGVWFDF